MNLMDTHETSWTKSTPSNENRPNIQDSKGILTTINIRRAVPDDASSIAPVIYSAFTEYETSYTPQAFQATTPTAEQIRNRMNEGPVWVAVDQGTVVGTVSAVPKRTSLYIRSMAIVSAARGRGIGRKLLEHAEEYALDNGFKGLVLSTTPFLTQAIQLYKRYGFQSNKAGPHDLYGTPLITMVKAFDRTNSA